MELLKLHQVLHNRKIVMTFCNPSWRTVNGCSSLFRDAFLCLIAMAYLSWCLIVSFSLNSTFYSSQKSLQVSWWGHFSEWQGLNFFLLDFISVTDIGPKIQYFLLCDSLHEEKLLREDLQRQRLVSITLWIFLFEIPWLARGKFRPFKWQVNVLGHTWQSWAVGMISGLVLFLHSWVAHHVNGIKKN